MRNLRTDTILIGREREIKTISLAEWESALAKVPQHFEKKLGFMTAEHHKVRYFVVRELPVAGEPLSVESIAEQVNLPASRVTVILEPIAQKLINLMESI